MTIPTNNQKGVSLIITLFIMIIILFVVLSISSLLYSQVKVIRNVGDSVVSFYAADSGVEKVLYYDRQVLALATGGKAQISRGLCSMIDPNNPDGTTTNNLNCSVAHDNSLDPSIYCENSTPSPFTATGGCDPNNCNNCTITFDTTFDNNTRYYKVTAAVDTNTYYLHITSKGVFPNGNLGAASREIDTSSPLTP